MTKCFSTVLFLSSVIAMVFSSCGGKKVSAPETKEAQRFEQLLNQAGLHSKDSLRYLIWNSTSCGGCRATCVRLLQDNKLPYVKLIVPLRFADNVSKLSPSTLFVDTNGVFDKIYFGIDNIGLANIYDDHVISMKNYNPEAMDSLSVDLLKY